MSVLLTKKNSRTDVPVVGAAGGFDIRSRNYVAVPIVPVTAVKGVPFATLLT